MFASRARGLSAAGARDPRLSAPALTPFPSAASWAPPLPPVSSPHHFPRSTPGGVAQNTPGRTPSSFIQDRCVPSTCSFCSSVDHHKVCCQAPIQYLEQGKVACRPCGNLYIPGVGGELSSPLIRGRNTQGKVNGYWTTIQAQARAVTQVQELRAQQGECHNRLRNAPLSPPHNDITEFFKWLAACEFSREASGHEDGDPDGRRFTTEAKPKSEPLVETPKSCDPPAVPNNHHAPDTKATIPTYDLEASSGLFEDSTTYPSVTSNSEDDNALDWYLEMCFEHSTEDLEPRGHPTVETGADLIILAEFPTNTTPSVQKYPRTSDAESVVLAQHILPVFVAPPQDDEKDQPPITFKRQRSQMTLSSIRLRLKTLDSISSLVSSRGPSKIASRIVHPPVMTSISSLLSPIVTTFSTPRILLQLTIHQTVTTS